MSEAQLSVRAIDVVAEALSWLNTPFAHQQRVKGVGVDCVNYIAAVCEATGATRDVEFESNYRRHEDGAQMLSELVRYLEPVEWADGARLADIVAFHDGFDSDVPRHIAFITRLAPYVKIAHASQHGVRNHRMDAHFKSRIHSIWRRPGLVYV